MTQPIKKKNMKELIKYLNGWNKDLADFRDDEDEGIAAHKQCIELCHKNDSQNATIHENENLILCPVCVSKLDIKDKYCWNCGQRVSIPEGAKILSQESIITNILNNFDSFITSIARPATYTNVAIYEHWCDCRSDIEKVCKKQSNY